MTNKEYINLSYLTPEQLEQCRIGKAEIEVQYVTSATTSDWMKSEYLRSSSGPWRWIVYDFDMRESDEVLEARITPQELARCEKLRVVSIEHSDETGV